VRARAITDGQTDKIKRKQASMHRMSRAKPHDCMQIGADREAVRTIYISLEMIPPVLVFVPCFNSLTEGGGAGVFEGGAAHDAVELLAGQSEVQHVGLQAVGLVVFFDLQLVHAHVPGHSPSPKQITRI